MKVKFLATGNAPTHYLFSGSIVEAHYNNNSESFDLSSLGSNDRFTSISVDYLELASGHIIRDAYRDSSGELHVTLCQKVGPGHWSESDWIDVDNYEPSEIQVKLDTSKPFAGNAFVVTSEGKQWVK